MIGTGRGEVRLRGNYSGNKDEKNEQATGHGGRSKGAALRAGKPYGLNFGTVISAELRRQGASWLVPDAVPRMVLDRHGPSIGEQISL